MYYNHDYNILSSNLVTFKTKIYILLITFMLERREFHLGQIFLFKNFFYANMKLLLYYKIRILCPWKMSFLKTQLLIIHSQEQGGTRSTFIWYCGNFLKRNGLKLKPFKVPQTSLIDWDVPVVLYNQKRARRISNGNSFERKGPGLVAGTTPNSNIRAMLAVAQSVPG